MSGWITDRVPEENGDVLATVELTWKGKPFRAVRILYYEDGKFYDERNEYCIPDVTDKVLAWAELLTVYEGD